MALSTPLHEAASSGDVDKVRDLVGGGKYDVNCVDKLGYTPLHWAADRGHLGVVRLLISEFKACVDTLNSSSETPLHMAANRGHLPVVRMLISKFKADVSAHNNHGETPLHMAANRGHMVMVRVLISEFKADVNACSNNGGTALHLAANKGHLDVVRVLISEFRADLSACTVSGETALHMAANRGHLDMARVLISEFRADVCACTVSGETALHMAAHNGHLYMVKALVSEFKADVNACTNTGITPFEMAVNSKNEKLALVLMDEFQCDTKGGTHIHTAYLRGWVNLVRALLQKHGTGILNPNVVLLHDITVKRWREVAVMLLEEFGLSVQDRKGQSLLHVACKDGDISLVRTLINDGKANVTLRDDEGKSPFDTAVNNSHEELALALMNEFNCDTNGGTPYIHTACEKGWINLVRALVHKHGTDILKNDCGCTSVFDMAVDNSWENLALGLMNEFHCDTKGGTPYIHRACGRGWVNLIRALLHKHGTGILNPNVVLLPDIAVKRWREVAVMLLEEFGLSVQDRKGQSVLHIACEEGDISLVRTLINDGKADVTHRDNEGRTPFDIAFNNSHGEKLALVLMNQFHCDTKGGTPYIHTACERGWVNLVRALLQKHGTGILNPDVVRRGEVAVMLVKEFGLSVLDCKGRSLLHTACEEGDISLVRTLINDGKADVTLRDNEGRKPFDVAFYNRHEELALILMNEFHCDTKGGTPYIHTACQKGWVNLVRALLQKHGTGILNPDVVKRGEVAVMLVKEFGSSVKGHRGRSLLHIACKEGDMSLVRTLINDGKADVTLRDNEGNTPFDIAFNNRHEELAMVLMNEGHCDTKGGTPYIRSACRRGWVNLVQALVEKHGTGILKNDVPGHLGSSLLHLACSYNSTALVRFLSRYISPWVVDYNGDTPLHICARLGREGNSSILLELDPPVMIRNNLGQTPKDVEEKYGGIHRYIATYMKVKKDKIDRHYKLVQKHAKKKYSLSEPITRAFVVGNPGAGKSSLVEALKREGFVDSFKRVSESSVPPHTAGIVPSIHSSKHYGRVLFYDFAGDAEYYSSHSAILENLASSRKGDNIFLLVVDMREEVAEIKKIFHYWLSFIQHHQYNGQVPYLMVVGSHLDLLTEDVAKTRGEEFQMFCDSIDTGGVQMSALTILDCCKPRSRQISGLQTHLSSLTKKSPRLELSFQASVLLGLLEKDFTNVPACSTQTLLTHIEETGIELPTDPQLFHSILLELHDLGLLFLIQSSNKKSSTVVLNMSQLTSIVHKSLFSDKAVLKASFEREGLSLSFSAGIIPQRILAEILPENITKECLVQLQYCQEISHAEAHVFPSLKVSDSTDQSFLFFPALCSADKSEVEWVTPPDLSYGIGWLARCTDPCDYLSPRFHHVLMLRLVFKFTLSAHPPADQFSSGSPDLSHFQRRCTMWKTGVHWLMEEGVECMVELVGANREVVVLAKSTNDLAESCATVFNNIVSCVMEAKVEFFHSVRLEFFLLDSTSEADYHSPDNLFAMSEVEEVLTSADGRAEVVVSASGKRQMRRLKLLCLRNFTLWYSLFPMDFKSVLRYIKDVVRELYMLGLHLGIPKGILDAIEVENRTDVSRMRRELVNRWMSSSLDPPCWWHLVNGLRAVECGVLAEEIAREFGKLCILYFC